MTLTRFRIRALVERRHGIVLLALLLTIATHTLTRLVLLISAAEEVSYNASLVAAFGWGFLFDLAAALAVSAPLVVVLAILPEKFFTHSWARGLAHVGFVLSVF